MPVGDGVILMELDSNLEALARPLGHIVIEFSYLEIDLGILIARMAKSDDLFGATIASLGSTAKIEIARKLAVQRISDPRLADTAKALLARAEKLNAERNKYVHGEFMPVVDHQEKYVGMVHRTVRTPTKPFEDVKPGTLEMIANSIRSLANEMREFSATMHDLYPD
jgi:hypothetical protein